MYNKIFIGLIGLSLFVSCKQSPPQYPTNYNNQGFLEKSKISAKKRLIYEGSLIQKYIDKSETDFLKADGGMFVSRLPESSDYKPHESDTLTYVYQIQSLSDSIIYHKDSLGLQKHVLGKTSIIRGLEYSLKLMSEGQSMTSIVPSSLAYGYTGDGKAINGDQPIILNIELLKINHE